jgi:tetratricopeptide (TPR) repeat protein
MWNDLKDQARRLFEEREYEQAAGLFHHLVDTAPDPDQRAATLIFEVRCLEGLGRFAEARSCLEEARQLGDGSDEYLARLYYIEAGIDAREGYDEVALAKLNKLLADLGDVPQTPEYRDLYEGIQILRAGRLQNLKRPREALPLFLESQNFNSQKPSDHLYRMAYSMAQCGQSERAAEIVTQQLGSSLDISMQCIARYYLGAIYATQGEYRKALKELHFCEEHLGDSDLAVPQLMDSIADAYEKMGMPDKAIQYLRAAGTRREA